MSQKLGAQGRLTQLQIRQRAARAGWFPPTATKGDSAAPQTHQPLPNGGSLSERPLGSCRVALVN